MQLVIQVLPSLHIPDQTLQQRPATVGQNCHWQALACVLTLEAQPVPSTCAHACMRFNHPENDSLLLGMTNIIISEKTIIIIEKTIGTCCERIHVLARRSTCLIGFNTLAANW